MELEMVVHDLKNYIDGLHKKIEDQQKKIDDLTRTN
jgi:hypothetical protein